MLRHEITHCRVEMKCNCDRYRCDDDSDQPIKNGGALHNKVPVSFSGRYFERALEIRNTQFCPFVCRLGRSPSGRYMELAADRSRRAAFRGSITGNDPARRLRGSLLQQSATTG